MDLRDLKSFIISTPRIARNLILLPGLFICTLTSIIFYKFAGFIPTLIYVILSIESLYRLAKDSQSKLEESDFRATWSKYNFRIKYYISLWICFLISILLKPFIGYYFLLTYLISFSIFRLYGFEASEILRSNTQKINSSSVISRDASDFGRKDIIQVSNKRDQNLQRFLSILKEIDPVNYSRNSNKATFSSWFGNTEAELKITTLEKKLEDGNKDCEEYFRKILNQL